MRDTIAHQIVDFVYSPLSRWLFTASGHQSQKKVEL